MRNSGIYCWTSPSNKRYIGQAVDLHKRRNSFVAPNCYYTSSDSAIDRARKKYSDFSKWTYEILEYCNIDKLDEREVYWIEYYDTYNKGYNSTIGGQNGARCLKMPDSAKKRLSELAKLRIGDKNPNFGNHWSDELRKRMSMKKTGTKQSREQILKKSKRVAQYDLNGNLIRYWDSMTEAGNYYNVDKACIMRVCQGKQNTSAGYKWKYA